MCVCVCVCVCMYIYMYTHTHTHTCVDHLAPWGEGAHHSHSQGSRTRTGNRNAHLESARRKRWFLPPAHVPKKAKKVCSSIFLDKTHNIADFWECVPLWSQFWPRLAALCLRKKSQKKKEKFWPRLAALCLRETKAIKKEERVLATTSSAVSEGKTSQKSVPQYLHVLLMCC